MLLSLFRLAFALMTRETLSGQVAKLELNPNAVPLIGKVLQLTWPCRPCRYNATAPVTCGAACEVPDNKQNVLIGHIPPPEAAETTCTPGAKRSTRGPQFEFGARTPFQSTLPTVRTSATFAGAPVLALALPLPAAATTVIPWLMAFWTADSTPTPVASKRLILATTGVEGLA